MKPGRLGLINDLGLQRKRLFPLELLKVVDIHGELPRGYLMLKSTQRNTEVGAESKLGPGNLRRGPGFSHA